MARRFLSVPPGSQFPQKGGTRLGVNSPTPPRVYTSCVNPGLAEPFLLGEEKCRCLWRPEAQSRGPGPVRAPRGLVASRPASASFLPQLPRRVCLPQMATCPAAPLLSRPPRACGCVCSPVCPDHSAVARGTRSCGRTRVDTAFPESRKPADSQNHPWRGRFSTVGSAEAGHPRTLVSPPAAVPEHSAHTHVGTESRFPRPITASPQVNTYSGCSQIRC